MRLTTTGRFEEQLTRYELEASRGILETLQVNMGKLCNQACTHWHVDAGPVRTELMTRETTERILTLLADAPCIDLQKYRGAQTLESIGLWQ